MCIFDTTKNSGSLHVTFVRYMASWHLISGPRPESTFKIRSRDHTGGQDNPLNQPRNICATVQISYYPTKLKTSIQCASFPFTDFLTNVLLDTCDPTLIHCCYQLPLFVQNFRYVYIFLSIWLLLLEHPRGILSAPPFASLTLCRQ